MTWARGRTKSRHSRGYRTAQPLTHTYMPPATVQLAVGVLLALATRLVQSDEEFPPPPPTPPPPTPTPPPPAPPSCNASSVGSNCTLQEAKGICVLGTNSSRNDTDTQGCLVMVKGQNNIWIVHSDGSRNWVGKPTSGCAGNALFVPDVEVYQKRSSNHNLNEQDSAAACQNNKCEPLGAGGMAPVPANAFVYLL